MADSRKTNRHEEEYEKELEWLVEETAKLKIDLRGLVLAFLAAIIALARRQDRRSATRHSRAYRKHPPAQ